MSLDASKTREVKLTRGKAGLGFNIRGGIDIPHLPEDKGIFVSKIHKDGTAAKDGRLNEGDKIISVNGNRLFSVSHNQAVAYFRENDVVSLTFIPGAEKSIVEHRKTTGASTSTNSSSHPSSSKNGITIGMAIAGVAMLIVSVYVGYRYYKTNRLKGCNKLEVMD